MYEYYYQQAVIKHAGYSGFIKFSCPASACIISGQVDKHVFRHVLYCKISGIDKTYKKQKDEVH